MTVWSDFKENLKKGSFFVRDDKTRSNLPVFLAINIVHIAMFPVSIINGGLKLLRPGHDANGSIPASRAFWVKLLDFPRYLAIRVLRVTAIVATVVLSLALIPVTELILNPIVSGVAALFGKKIGDFYKKNTPRIDTLKAWIPTWNELDRHRPTGWKNELSALREPLDDSEGSPPPSFINRAAAPANAAYQQQADQIHEATTTFNQTSKSKQSFWSSFFKKR